MREVLGGKREGKEGEGDGMVSFVPGGDRHPGVSWVPRYYSLMFADYGRRGRQLIAVPSEK